MNHHKSICILSDDYPSPNRPVYVFVEQLVYALLDLETDIYIVAPQSLIRSFFRRLPLLPQKQKYRSPHGQEYWVYRPYSFSFGKGHTSLYRIFKGYNNKVLESVLDKIKPDILYGHFWHNANKMKDYARKQNLPLFVACGEGDNAMEELVAHLSYEEKRQLTESVSGVICVSTENKRRCISLGLAYENNLVVLPNATDTTKFHPLERNIELRCSMGVENDDFLILFVGSFSPRKGCNYLAEAINKINDPKIKVIFVGESFKGYDYDPVCQGIVYKGKVAHEKLPLFYASADVFVLPTQKEGCCNAIVEALACGLPVISSNRPFNDDILNNCNSIKINPTDNHDILTAILKMKNDKKFYQQLKRNVVSSAANYSIIERARLILAFINKQIQS